MKRLVLFCLFGLLAAGLLPGNARADMGPKPSVEVAFEGISGEKAYATLLSKESPWGPYSAWDGHREADKGYAPEVWEKFVRYKDPDGFFFLQTYNECVEGLPLIWGYWPPDTFKILVYFPGTDTFVASGIQERYAFESYFQCFVSQGGMLVRSSYDYGRGFAAAALRALLTLLIELAVALPFGYREKGQLLLFGITNLVTQAGLCGGLYLISYTWGPWAFWYWFVVLELAVLVVESLTYTLLIGRCSKSPQAAVRVRRYALLANLLSCGAGLVLARLTLGGF